MRLSLIVQGIGMFVGAIMLYIGLNVVTQYESFPDPIARGMDWILGGSSNLEQNMVFSIIEGLGALLMLISFVLIIVGLVLSPNIPEKQVVIQKKEIKTLYCSQCGTKVPSDSTFCYKCGKKIE